jgi:hypothetical protein
VATAAPAAGLAQQTSPSDRSTFVCQAGRGVPRAEPVTERKHFKPTPSRDSSGNATPRQGDQARPVPRTLQDVLRAMAEHQSPAVRAVARRLLAEGEHASSNG